MAGARPCRLGASGCGGVFVGFLWICWLSFGSWKSCALSFPRFLRGARKRDVRRRRHSPSSSSIPRAWLSVVEQFAPDLVVGVWPGEVDHLLWRATPISAGTAIEGIWNCSADARPITPAMFSRLSSPGTCSSSCLRSTSLFVRHHGFFNGQLHHHRLGPRERNEEQCVRSWKARNW